MKLCPGDDVWVDFEGREWPGEVIRTDKGWVLANILVADDPSWDFGSLSARMSPLSTVAVPAGRVRERV